MRSFLKILFLFAGSCVVFAGLLEMGSTFIYRAYRGVPFDRDAVRQRLNADLKNEMEVHALDGGPAIADQPVILHPYFGFVINPEKSGVNEHGFFRASPLTVRSPEKVVIAFFGGSVADQVYYMAGDTLVEELQDRPGYAGKEIELITTAVGGYKQPQQMIVLATLMALGAEFDVVINLDGFNEIDTAHDNVVEGVNPYFPHAWKLQARRGFDAETARRMGRIELIREERRRLKQLFAQPLLQRSAFFLSLWDFLDGGREANLRREMAELDLALSAHVLPPQIQGPPVDYPDMAVFFADMADLWARASLSMARLSAANDTVYAHFLQPNQYVPASKRLTAEERDVAYDPTFAGKDRVPQGYPLLIEAGENLRRQGVSFTDLTMIFADEDRTVYNDFCCHVNELGADIIARQIAAALPNLD
jgi:hypothetical protein